MPAVTLAKKSGGHRNVNNHYVSEQIGREMDFEF
jgi:hypothetical protein